MSVGERIVDYMQNCGISQIHVSRKSGIPPAKLNLILRGKRRLQVVDYQAICFALDVNPDRFIEPKPKPTKMQPSPAPCPPPMNPLLLNPLPPEAVAEGREVLE